MNNICIFGCPGGVKVSLLFHGGDTYDEVLINYSASESITSEDEVVKCLRKI